MNAHVANAHILRCYPEDKGNTQPHLTQDIGKTYVSIIEMVKELSKAFKRIASSSLCCRRVLDYMQHLDRRALGSPHLTLVKLILSFYFFLA